MIKLRLHKTLRLMITVLGIIVAITLVAVLAIQYRIHVANEWQQYSDIPPMSAPIKGDSIIVFAPHSDDETLGCGGMLAQAVRSGAKVHVVLVTNGDGFRFAVGRAYKTIRVTPSKCIEFAYKRQQETLDALAVLGVSSNSVTFLGYPDRGIAKMWNNFWTSDNLYTSRTTKTDHSPYSDSFTRYAPYCGESLLRDMTHILKKTKPTDVFVPHPLDNHPDHYATYCFAAAAIEQLKANKSKFANKIRIHTYLVHRGDWPVPRAASPKEHLSPPYALANGDTTWYSLKLDSDVTRKKHDAIKEYKTQTAIEKGFLMSFARENEIFGTEPDRKVKQIGQGMINIDGDPADWWSIPPAVVDPIGDYVVADLNKGGDVRAIYMCSDSDFLYLRMDCVKNLSRGINYTVNLRRISDKNTNDWYTVTIRPPHKSSPSGTIWAYKGNVLEIAIPLSKLTQNEDIFVQVKTTTMNLTVDQTGWNSLEFGGDERVQSHIKPAG